MLELKRGGHARVRTEMVEFIALPFPSSKKNLKYLLQIHYRFTPLHNKQIMK